MIEPAALHAAGAVPEAAVLCFFADVIENLSSEGRARECARWRGEEGVQVMYDLELDGGHVALLHPGVGASLAAIRLENAIALGCRRFVACGGAGALVPELALGHVVVEMEAAALLAVAQFRQVPLVSLLYAGDSLAGDEWDHRSWDRHDGRETLFGLAAEAALRL